MTAWNKALGLALLTALLTGGVAAAQPDVLGQGSALIYPLFDSSAGAGTVICVTNTGLDMTYCPETDFRVSDILIHYQYVAGDDCLEFDRYELLTPGDTLCVIADLHNPEQDRGYLAVSAVDPSTGLKVEYDYLIGSAIVVQSDLNFLWSYTPFVFDGDGATDTIVGPCERNATDIDGDGAMDFGYDSVNSGMEYGYFPRVLYIDSFFEERNNFSNQLTLMSTAGQDYINEVNVWFWNNVEERYSRTFKFVCWWSGPLSEISAIASDLGGDPEELGHPPVQTGWVEIAGNRVLDLAGNPVVYPVGHGDEGEVVIPPLLGVFAQFIGSSSYAAGHALHYEGMMDGLEILNGNGQ